MEEYEDISHLVDALTVHDWELEGAGLCLRFTATDRQIATLIRWGAGLAWLSLLGLVVLLS